MGADVVGVAGVYVMPSGFHACDLRLVVEKGQKFGFKIGGSRARDYTGDVHIRIAGASKTEINDPDNFVVVI